MKKRPVGSVLQLHIDPRHIIVNIGDVYGWSVEIGMARATELQQANLGYEYSLKPFLELPIWVTRMKSAPEL